MKLKKAMSVVLAGCMAASAVPAALAANVGGELTSQQQDYRDPLRGIVLNKTTLTIDTEHPERLAAVLDPVDSFQYYEDDIKWTTSDKLIATVDEDGMVTPVREGTATITASVGGFSASCQVTVVKRVPLTGVALNKTKAVLQVGEKETLKVNKFLPENTTDYKGIEWRSGNPKVAAVDSTTGVVTAVAKGNTVITAVATDVLDDYKVLATCEVEVRDDALRTIKITPQVNVVEVGSTVSYGVTRDPVTNKTPIEWSSDKPDVLSIDANGVAAAKKVGTVTITAQANTPGVDALVSDRLVVKVVPATVKMTGLSLPDEQTVTLSKKSFTIPATYTPANTTEKSMVKWTSSDESIAKVDYNTGAITALKPGTVIIKAAYVDPKDPSKSEFIYDTCKLTVKDVVSSIAFQAVTGEEGTSVSLLDFVSLLNPYGKAVDPDNDEQTVRDFLHTTTIEWSTTSSNVAFVDKGSDAYADDDVLYLAAAGDATITARVNGVVKSVKVTVTPAAKKVTGVSLVSDLKKISSAYLMVGQTLDVTAQLSPAGAESYCIWSSSDENVAVVDDYGTQARITARKVGKAKVTVVVAGGKTATVDLVVLDPIDNTKKAVTDIFTDVVPGQWYVNAVQYVYENDIMAGVSRTKFNPDGYMTRAMVVQTLYNKAGAPAVSGNMPFSDVLKGTWYYNAILWAKQNGVAAGMGDGTFAPNAQVTREQFVQMLYGYSGSPAASGSLNRFADAASVSGWATRAVTWAAANGVLSGQPSGGALLVNPQGKATRAMAAAMLTNLFKK